MRISTKRWPRFLDAKHANAPRRRVPKTLRVKLLLRCNLLTYFKNFLSNLRPPVHHFCIRRQWSARRYEVLCYVL